MEENVISQIMKSDIKDLFNQHRTIQDVSGAGNNWGHGFGFYGPQYEEEIIEKVKLSLLRDSCLTFSKVEKRNRGM